MVSGLGIRPGSHRQMGLPGNNNNWQRLSRDNVTQPIISYQITAFYLAMLHTLEVDSADSPRPTRGRVTGIRLLDTSLALTNVSLLAVRVNDTLGLTPGDGVGVGDEAGLTSADGVTCPRH